MYSVEIYNRVRRACHVEGMSKSEAARVFGIDRKTVAKILKHSVPPGYRRSKPPARPKLDPFIPIIDQILEDDKGRLKKQRHTAKRVFERLRDEHGFTGGITIVTDYVREKKRRSREVFGRVPGCRGRGRGAGVPCGSGHSGWRRRAGIFPRSW
jgi:transposase